VRRKKRSKHHRRKSHKRKRDESHDGHNTLCDEIGQWIELEEKLADQRREDGRIARLKVIQARHRQ
jgi:hypothetical protein